MQGPRPVYRRHALAAFAWPALALFVALAAGVLFSLSTGGRSDVGFWNLISANPMVRTIVWDIRAPRTVVAALLGLNLGLAGLTLQAITRNALASPSILGINQGAAFGLCLALVFPAFIPLPPDVAAMFGAAATGAITLTIAGGLRGQIDSLRLVLGGVAVGAFAFAMVRFTYTLDDDITRMVVRWTVGDISDTRWPAAQRLALWALPGFIATLALSQRFNLMALGQASAQGVGIDPRKTLLFGTLVAAGLAGVSVSITGPIAFAGLVVPHITRTLFGNDYRILVPSTALMGAAMLLLADGLSKIIVTTGEAPVGVVAALIGAPWFLWQTLWSKDFA